MSEHDADAPGDGSRRPARRARRWTIAVVAVVVSLAGLMTGAGWSPTDVVDAIGDLWSGDPEIDAGAARPVAFDEAAGIRVELWWGPTIDGDGECRFVRTLSAISGSVDDEVRCGEGPMLPWRDPEFELVATSQYFRFVDETTIGSSESGFEAVAIGGAVHPEITAISANFGDGATYSFVPDPIDGWFAVLLPAAIADIDRERGGLVNVLVELELFDQDGRTRTTVDVPAWRLENE